MITTGPVEVFFKEPSKPESNDGECLLFHLRRDLEVLYGIEGQAVAISQSHVILATMGVLAGIDYLSQVYSPESSGRKRFVESVKDIIVKNTDHAESLYQLRCALIHQIGLSITSDSYRKDVKFSFELTDISSEPLIVKLSDSGTEVTYRIGFWELKAAFRRIIDHLLAICRSNNHPRFAHVLNEIGQRHGEKLLRK